MKKLISKTLLLVMLLASVLISCKKDNKGNKEPLMPPPESMFMDFSNFQALANKSLTADDTTLYNNWTASAVTVGIWSSIVYLNSAIPVAAFREAFNHPGVFSLTPQMSFMDALSQAGGVTKDGNFNEVHLIRPSADVNMKIDMSDILAPRKNLNVAINEGDIIFVPRHDISQFGYIIQQINPFGTLFTIGQIGALAP